MNEYLAQVQARTNSRPLTHGALYEKWSQEWNLRKELVARFAWAIPTDEAISLLVRYSPLVEIGAGTGYWAKLVREAGGVIHAFDKHPPRRGKNTKHSVEYVRVLKGGPRTLDRFDSSHNLFLCWPDYGNPCAANCARRFRGRYLIYVGEQGGCTADEAFQSILDTRWKEVERVALPQWEGIHDDLMVFGRRPLSS